jgi:hypothetical protein
MKKYIIGCAIVAIAALAAFNVSLNKEKTVAVNDFRLANVEAQADLLEWWNRPDYKCINVTCIAFLYTYKSTVAVYVGNGNGTVAHTWNCTGCGDNGWTVD